MPKLTKQQATTIQKTEPVKETGGFQLLPTGRYRARLFDVEAKTAQGSGNPYWSIQFTDIRDFEGEQYPGRQFYTLMLPQGPKPPKDFKGYDGNNKPLAEQWKSVQDGRKGKLAGFFAAFGFTADSDTDEMLGEECVISVGRRKDNRPDAVDPELMQNFIRGLLTLEECGLTPEDAEDDEDEYEDEEDDEEFEDEEDEEEDDEEYDDEDDDEEYEDEDEEDDDEDDTF